VTAKLRQVFAFSGVLNRPPEEKPDPALLEYAVSLAAGSGVTRACFIPTATGDSPGAIEAVTEVFAGREDVEFSVLKLFTQPNVPDVRARLLGQDVPARRLPRSGDHPPQALTATINATTSRIEAASLVGSY
jgi:hypothetical protein